MQREKNGVLIRCINGDITVQAVAECAARGTRVDRVHFVLFSDNAFYSVQ